MRTRDDRDIVSVSIKNPLGLADPASVPSYSTFSTTSHFLDQRWRRLLIEYQNRAPATRILPGSSNMNKESRPFHPRFLYPPFPHQPPALLFFIPRPPLFPLLPLIYTKALQIRLSPTKPAPVQRQRFARSGRPRLPRPGVLHHIHPSIHISIFQFILTRGQMVFNITTPRSLLSRRRRRRGRGDGA